MNTVTGVIASVKGDSFKMIPPTPMKDFNLNFGDGSVAWVVGIDPASKFTGLCFLREDEGLLVLLDCVRDKLLQKEVYERELFYLLTRLTNGISCDYTGGFSVMSCRSKIEIREKFR